MAARPRAARQPRGGGAARSGAAAIAACKVAAVVCTAALTAGGAVEVNHLTRDHKAPPPRAAKAVAAPAPAPARGAGRPRGPPARGHLRAAAREARQAGTRRRRRRRRREARDRHAAGRDRTRPDDHRPGAADRPVRRRPGPRSGRRPGHHHRAAGRQRLRRRDPARGPAGRPARRHHAAARPERPAADRALKGSDPFSGPDSSGADPGRAVLGSEPSSTSSRSTHEALLVRRGRRSGLYTIVAVHSTARGPSLGGCRMWTYADERAAVRDALRLSRAMTFKSAVAGLPLGGGKGVIMLPAGTAPPTGDARRDVLLDFGDTVQALDGAYITAEDVGTSEPDMRTIAEVTSHVSGLAVESGGSGDPSPWTAIGVEAAIRVGCERAFGTDVARGPHDRRGRRRPRRRPAGRVARGGRRDARARRHRRGAARARRPPGRAVDGPALGADRRRRRRRAVRARRRARRRDRPRSCAAASIAGAANNQLATESVGELLADRGILWVPDFVANAGGSSTSRSSSSPRATTRPRAEERVRAIGDTVRTVLDHAGRDRHDPARGGDGDRPPTRGGGRDARLRGRVDDRRSGAALGAQLLQVRAQRHRRERPQLLRARRPRRRRAARPRCAGRDRARRAAAPRGRAGARCTRRACRATSQIGGPWPGPSTARSRSRSSRRPSR